MENEASQQYLKPKELESRLNISSNTRKRWDKEGKFPNSLGIGKGRRYAIGDIEAVEAKQTPKVKTQETITETSEFDKRRQLADAEGKALEAERRLGEEKWLRDLPKVLVERERAVKQREDAVISEEEKVKSSKQTLEFGWQQLLKKDKEAEVYAQSKREEADDYAEAKHLAADEYYIQRTEQAEALIAEKTMQVENMLSEAKVETERLKLEADGHFSMEKEEADKHCQDRQTAADELEKRIADRQSFLTDLDGIIKTETPDIIARYKRLAKQGGEWLDYYGAMAMKDRWHYITQTAKDILERLERAFWQAMVG